jgi:uncharacterized protein YecT (DUF1311 family)
MKLVMQEAQRLATASLSDQVLLTLEAQYLQRRAEIVRSSSDTTVYLTETEYQAALTALNATYQALVDNVATNRHHSACHTDLAPFNMPSTSSISKDIAWDGSLSAGARSSLLTMQLL